MKWISFFALRASSKFIECTESKVWTEEFDSTNVIEISVQKYNTSIIFHTVSGFEAHVYDSFGEYIGYMSDDSHTIVNFGNQIGSIFVHKTGETANICFSSIIYSDYDNAKYCSQYITTNIVDNSYKFGGSLSDEPDVAIMKGDFICAWITSPNADSFTVSETQIEKITIPNSVLLIINASSSVNALTTITPALASSTQTTNNFYSSYFALQSSFIRNGEIVRDITDTVSEKITVTSSNRVILKLSNSLVVYFHDIAGDTIVYDSTGAVITTLTTSNPAFDTGFSSEYKIIISNINSASVSYSAFLMDGNCQSTIINSEYSAINSAFSTNNVCILYPALNPITITSQNQLQYTVYRPNENLEKFSTLNLENTRSCMIYITGLTSSTNVNIQVSSVTAEEAIKFYSLFYPTYTSTVIQPGAQTITPKTTTVTVDTQIVYNTVQLKLGEIYKLDFTSQNYTLFFTNPSSSIHYAILSNGTRINFDQFIDFGNNIGSVYFQLPYSPKIGTIVYSAAKLTTPFKLITNELYPFSIWNPTLSASRNISMMYSTGFSYWIVSETSFDINIQSKPGIQPDYMEIYWDKGEEKTFLVKETTLTYNAKSFLLQIMFNDIELADYYVISFSNHQTQISPITSFYFNPDSLVEFNPPQYVEDVIVYKILNTWNIQMFTNGIRSLFILNSIQAAFVIHDNQYKGQAFYVNDTLIGNFSYDDGQYGAFFPHGGYVILESPLKTIHISSMFPYLMDKTCRRFGISNIPYTTFSVLAKEPNSNFTVKSGMNEITTCYWYSFPESTPTDISAELYIRDKISAFTDNSTYINTTIHSYAQQFKSIFIALETADNSYFTSLYVYHKLNQTKYDTRLSTTFLDTTDGFILTNDKADPKIGLTRSKTPGILGMIIFLCVTFVVALIAFIIIQLRMMISTRNPHSDNSDESQQSVPHEIHQEEGQVELNSDDELNIAIQRSLQDHLHLNEVDETIGPQSPPPSNVIAENIDTNKNQNPYSIENMNEPDDGTPATTNPFEADEY